MAMCSKQPWPLLWQRVLSRSSWSNPVSMRRREGMADVLGQCLDADVNIWIRQNEKDKKPFCNACMCYMLCLDLLYGWISLSSSLSGRKFVLLPQDDNGCLHLDWGHVTIHGICSRQRHNSWSLECCFVAVDVIRCRRWYSRGASTWFLHITLKSGPWLYWFC